MGAGGYKKADTPVWGCLLFWCRSGFSRWWGVCAVGAVGGKGSGVVGLEEGLVLRYPLTDISGLKDSPTTEPVRVAGFVASVAIKRIR